MTLPGAGELAAMGCAVSWSLCAQCFAAAGRRIGSVAVNHLRLVVALMVVTALHVVVLGRVGPLGLDTRDVTLLLVSGVVGLALGDACGFRGLVLVGPAVVTLVMTTWPALATLMAWWFLDEPVRPRAVLGMLVTMAGVLVAVGKRGLTPFPRAEKGSDPVAAFGLLLAFGGAVGQAGGAVLARPALEAAVPLEATWLRLVGGVTAIWGFTVIRAMVARSLPAWMRAAPADGAAVAQLSLGAVLGPAVGVWMSQVALKHASVPVATTLMAITPVFVLAENWAVLGRRPEANEVTGSLVAVAGVGLLVS